MKVRVGYEGDWGILVITALAVIFIIVSFLKTC